MKRLLFRIACLFALVSPAPAFAQYWVLPPKSVVLLCPPYEFHCSISRRANPEYESYCFYVTGGRSWPMKTDYRFGFYTGPLRLRLHNGLRITALLEDVRSGRRALCSE